METVLIEIMHYLYIFILVLVRVTALFILTPIFGTKNTPSMLKVGLGAIIALIIVPTITGGEVYQSLSLIAYAGIVIREFLVGLLLGFVTYMAFIALYVAGQIIDMQMGFGIVSVIDPQSGEQIPVIANIYNIIALLLLLSLNGHHMIITSIFYSYHVLPVGMLSFTPYLLTNIVGIFTQMFILGFTVAAPVIAVLFLTNVLLGILAKTVPQMNVFVVGMPLKIAIGLLMLAVLLPMFPIIMDSIVNGMMNNLSTILKDMILR